MTTKLDHQKKLEYLYSKNQLIPRIKEEFLNYEKFSFEKHCIDNSIPPDFGIDLLVQMALHKRADLSTLVGILRHHFGNGQETVEYICAAAYAGLVDFDTRSNVFVVIFTIPDKLQAEIDRFQYPLPMVVKPQKITNNTQIGYLLNHSSIILKDNHHEDDVCLDHINRINRIKFCINLNTATMIKNRWRNMDKPKNGESSNDFKRRQRAFNKYDSTSQDVIALLIQEGNEFYLTHRYDKRGRIYCQGYHVNYQGNPWNKAVIELVNQEITT